MMAAGLRAEKTKALIKIRGKAKLQNALDGVVINTIYCYLCRNATTATCMCET